MNVWLDKLLTHIRIPVTSVPQLYSYGKELDKVFSIGYSMLSSSSLYVESIDNYVKVHLADGSSILSKISLRSMEEQLSPGEFIRIFDGFEVSIPSVSFSPRRGKVKKGQFHASHIQPGIHIIGNSQCGRDNFSGVNTIFNVTAIIAPAVIMKMPDTMLVIFGTLLSSYSYGSVI